MKLFAFGIFNEANDVPVHRKNKCFNFGGLHGVLNAHGAAWGIIRLNLGEMPQVI